MVNLEYLKKLADYPISVVLYGNRTFTWVESRVCAIALRGRVESGLDLPLVAEPESWWPVMHVVLGSQVRGWRVSRDALAHWAGAPWWPPADPCACCQGTGTIGGKGVLGVPVALRDGVLVDRNVLARVLSVLPAGSLTLEAPAGVHAPVRLRASDGSLAAIARMTGDTEGMETFEAWTGAGEAPKGRGGIVFQLGGERVPVPIEIGDLSRLDVEHGVQAIEGPGDRRCSACGGAVRTGQCSRCGKIGR